MTREQAKQIAIEAAKRRPPTYYTEPFEPHAWVIDAIIAAVEHDRARQAVSALQE